VPVCHNGGMVNNIIKCRFCQNDQVVKNGRYKNGVQNHLCRACGKQFRENPKPRKHPPEFREMILKAYQERMSLRGIRRAFGVAPKTVIEWAKKNS